MRSGVDLSQNMGVRVSYVKLLNCFILHPTSMISKHTQQSRSLTACRRLENVHFDIILDDVKLADISNNSFE